ncbi:MAG: competence/damage-inducible protein A [Cytophagales bacterium]
MLKIKTAEIITIGDEILIGQITDTNTQYISSVLVANGIEVIRKSSVGDTENEILKIFSEAFTRADLVITTGGLGPTKDDITKNTICKYFNTQLVPHQETLKKLEDFFKERGKELTEINKQQAFVPQNCKVLVNNYGTAPGMLFETPNNILISLPGVPFEMKALMNEQVLPYLSSQTKENAIAHKTILTAGIGESYLAEKIAFWEQALPSHIKLAYLPSFGSVKLRLTAIGSDKQRLLEEIEKLFTEIYPLLDTNLISTDFETLEEAFGDIFKEKKLTVATAESCTGGAVGATIIKVAGSSSYFMGSITSYSNSVKQSLLGVQEETLTKFGAVSEETVIEMATGACRKLQSTIAISISGIAGPEGGTTEKPVGTIWIAISNGEITETKKLVGTKIREANINYAISQALYICINFVKKHY